MTRHRLTTPACEPVEVGRSPRAYAFTMLKLLAPAEIRRRLTRASRAPAFNIAVIVPLILASAVSGEARGPVLFPSASPFTPVAVVSPTKDLSGPIVVAAARELASAHVIAKATGSAPPPAVLNVSTPMGIPSMALAAYRNAEKKMGAADPSCGVSWNLLAGIGRIESGHANGGATDAHGTPVRPIYGPALDGTLPGNEVIVASRGAGGATYERALGPMQFLPGTWAHYASDGDGDGVADPQNLYDSALGAAKYLCSGNLNLRDPSQVMTAILRYNNSMAYAQNVLGWAAAYATGVVPVDLPPITGAAPPLGDMHLEHPEGLGPDLPMNMHGLSSTDPLAQTPLIDFGPQSTQQPSNCTLICIGH